MEGRVEEELREALVGVRGAGGEGGGEGSLNCLEEGEKGWGQGNGRCGDSGDGWGDFLLWSGGVVAFSFCG